MKPYFWPILILLSIAGSAQQVPQITDAQAKEFFKAQSQMTQAMAAAADARTKYQDAITKLQQACGSTSSIGMSQAGDPVCIAKQAAKPEPAKKP